MSVEGRGLQQYSKFYHRITGVQSTKPKVKTRADKKTSVKTSTRILISKSRRNAFENLWKGGRAEWKKQVCLILFYFCLRCNANVCLSSQENESRRRGGQVCVCFCSQTVSVSIYFFSAWIICSWGWCGAWVFFKVCKWKIWLLFTALSLRWFLFVFSQWSQDGLWSLADVDKLKSFPWMCFHSWPIKVILTLIKNNCGRLVSSFGWHKLKVHYCHLMGWRL